jgi:hypothetical protein
MLMPFGKFRGTDIQDVPEQYLQWCADNVNLRSDLQSEINTELVNRNLKRVIAACEGCSEAMLVLVQEYVHKLEAEGYTNPLIEDLKASCAKEEVQAEQRQG